MSEMKVSIIIPIYNSEKTLNRLINSVVNQSYKNLEIILINDGSIDNSLKIINSFEKKDKRIKVINQKNQGVSKSRNKGLEVATGEYILFLDSDDYIDKDLIKIVLSKFKQNKVDLVIYGFYTEIYGEKLVSNYKTCLLKDKQSIKNNLINLWKTHMLYNVWNKIYKKEIIDKYNIKFPNYDYGEDIKFNMCYIEKVQSLYSLKTPLYYYNRENKNSLTNQYRENLFDIKLEEQERFINHFKNFNLKKEEYNYFLSSRYIERTLGCITNLYLPECNLLFKQKYFLTKEILLHPYTVDSLKIYKGKSKKMRLILMFYRIKSPLLTMFVCKLIYLIKKISPQIFYKAKNTR